MFRVKEIVCANKVYEYGYWGENVGVAILDSGIFLSHPDIKRRVIYFRDFENNKTFPYDDNGHGTHIAGIIAGNGSCSHGKITGMAKKANLIILKVLDEKGNGTAENAILALEWIQKNYKEYNIRLLNFSVGFLPNAGIKQQEELLREVEKLWDLGIIVVCAAGNNGPGQQSVTVPGVSRKVITVGSYKENDIAHYSGVGPTTCCIVKPEIIAPGTDIISLSHTEYGYVKKSGTSMSCPIVCGALALLCEKNKDITPQEAKLKLYVTAKKIQNAKIKHTWGLLSVDDLVLS